MIRSRLAVRNSTIFLVCVISAASAADNGEISKRARSKGLKDAPALIQASGITCTLTDARLVESSSRRSSFAGSSLSMDSGGGGGVGGGGGGGGGPPPDGGGGGPPGGGSSGGGGGPSPSMPMSNGPERYEVACSEGLGYLITAARERNQKPQAVLCLEANASAEPPRGGPPGAGGPPGRPPGPGNDEAQCLLPGNSNQAAALAPFIAKAGLSCTLTNARGIGHTAANVLFEVACDDNSGYVIATSAPPNADQPVQTSACADIPESSPVRCQLTNPAQSLAVVDKLISQSGKNCQVAERRMFGRNDAGDRFYEVSCTGSTGYVIQQLPSGEFGQAITCADIGSTAGGCQLKGNKPAN